MKLQPEDHDPMRRLYQGTVMRSLRAATACCDPIAKLPNFRRPLAKIPPGTLFSDFNDGSDPKVHDVVVGGFPWGLPETELIRMVWYSIPASLVVFAALQLAEQVTLFFEFNDSEGFGYNFLALAEGVSPKLAREMFLMELFRSNGETFNTAVSGGSPPNEVSSAFPRSTLLDCFLMVADRAVEYGEFWEEVLEMIAKKSKCSADTEFDLSTKRGRREAVGAYLAVVF